MVDEETPAAAVEALEQLRRDNFDFIASTDRPIPRPDDVTDAPTASGKWLQRASKRLHAELRVAAERDGVSFNTYCENALLRGHMTLAASEAMSNLADGVREDFKMRIGIEARNARYAFGGAKIDGKNLPEYGDYEFMEITKFEESQSA